MKESKTFKAACTALEDARQYPIGDLAIKTALREMQLYRQEEPHPSIRHLVNLAMSALSHALTLQMPTVRAKYIAEARDKFADAIPHAFGQIQHVEQFKQLQQKR